MSKSTRELLVDRERQCLRHALQAAGEHDRRAELAQPAGERERLAGREPAARERQHDAEERPRRAGAERARSGDHIRVDSLEGRDRRADVERARHERDGEHDRRLRERDARRRAGPTRPNAASSPSPATAGGSTSGSSTSVTTSARPRKRRLASRYASGVPNRRISACAISDVLTLTISASVTTGLDSWWSSLPGGTRRKIAATGSTQERERDSRRRQRQRAERARGDGSLA